MKKPSKEQIKSVKNQILLPIFIAAIAIGASYLLMHYAGKYFYNQTSPLQITVAEDGSLSMAVEGDRDDLYILWETDGGTVKPVEADADFAHVDDESNRGYLCYTHCDDKVTWDALDASGEEFETATVRAILYHVTEGEKKDFVGSESVETEVTITLSKDGGKTIKAAERYFSNPIKKSTSADWSEIYILKEDADSLTFRYRTSEELVTEEDHFLVLCWENDAQLISQTNLADGLFPIVTVSEDTRNQHQIKQSDTITVLKKDISAESELKAFLVDSGIYEKDTFTDDEKQAEAGYTLTPASE